MRAPCSKFAVTLVAVLTLGLACLPLAWDAGAQGYPIQVNSTLNGLDIVIDPVVAGSLVVVKLTNKSSKPARCEFEFINGPQLPDYRTTRIEPGKVQSIPFPIAREVTSMTINAVCTADGG